jgi:hypothetical protein
MMTTFRIEPEIMAGLRRIRERDGVPLSVQVDRALRAWLDSKDIETKAASRRVSARRKA